MELITFYLLFYLIIGGSCCFFGKRIFYFIFMFISFIGGFGLVLDYTGSTPSGLLLGICTGLICIFILHFFYQLGFFILGFSAGVVISRILLGVFAFTISDEQYHLIFVLLFSFLLGLCTLKWRDTLVVFATAIIGAVLISTVILFFILNYQQFDQFLYMDGMLSTILHLKDYLLESFIEENALFLFISTTIFSFLGIQYQKKK